MYDLCKTKNICEGGDEMDKVEEGQTEEEKKVKAVVQAIRQFSLKCLNDFGKFICVVMKIMRYSARTNNSCLFQNWMSSQ